MNESSTIAQFALGSEDLKDGERIPAAHSCEGEDLSPHLSWPEAPPGTKSFALIMDDPDAPDGTFRHWAVYDIPANVNELPRGDAGRFRQAVNDFGRAGYGGPCPPEGHGEHRYRFKLYALDVDALTVQPDAKVSQVEEEAKRHQVAMAELTGTYERK
jgi:Raf kinase inhibitor-like YbhB/YbcL family protein